MVIRVAALFCWFLALTVRGQATIPALLPVPGSAQQSQARNTVRETFKQDYAKTAVKDRIALAMTLVAQATETKDDPALRYVALTEAVDLAAGAGDAVTAVLAVDRLTGLYSINALDLMRQALGKAHAVSTPEQSEGVMRVSLELAERAAQVDSFELVQQFVSLADAAANKSKQLRMISAAQPKLVEYRELIAEYGKVRIALAKLEKEDGDAESHLVVGRFYALSKGQWSVGLPHLAKGNDAVLRELAVKELAHPGEGLAQAALGDGWWAYAEKATGRQRTMASAHATEWYKTAQSTIQGITLSRIQARIKSGLGEGANPAATDLLKLVDEKKDAIQGVWSRGGNGVVCEASGYAAMHLPHTLAEEFDLKTEFTRVEGDGSIAVLLACHGKTFGFALDIKGEARFERVDEKIAKDNPTVVPVAVSNNRRYTLTIEVRNDRVRALLDGKLLTEWKTDYKDLSRYSVWKMTDTTLPAVGANGAKVLFHAVQLVEITGKGKAAR